MEITTKGTTAAKNSFKKSNYYECVCLTKLHHFTFFHLYKVWNNLYHGWVGRVQTKYTMLCFHLLFWLFYVVAVVFHHTFFVFIIFIFFFDEVSNFNNRILINQNFKRLFKEASEHYLCKKLSLMSSSKLCTWINHVSKYRCIKVLLP